jgi:hypothetical protein
VPTKPGVEDDFMLRQIDRWWLTFISHRRQVIAAKTTSSAIAPVRPNF